MQREEFEKLIEEGFEKLPEWVRAKIQNVALLVEDEPSEEVRKREGLGEDETLLGYYHGIPLSERGEHYGIGATMPDTITLYKLPIEDAAAEELNLGLQSNLDLRNPEYQAAIKRVIVETIWHEFAHHFGMDEQEVRFREGMRDGSIPGDDA